ncbi:MAG: LysR family transcriptional regulator [Clostridia bacterium]|nr:LysR family transcriptional regulator [Clostridia bacterium]
MSLQKYAALLHAVELGSISKAAARMGYTQSAVSRMIADLEQEWGMPLLHRGRGGLEPTAAGQQLLPHLRAIVSDCSLLEYTVGELHGLHTGLVRVGTFTSVSDQWVPMLLTGFQQQYPGIEFDLMNSERYAEIEEWIRTGKVDCGFVSLPTVTDLDSVFLQRDMLMAVLPLNHPLTGSAVFPVEQLREERLIALKEDADYEIGRFLDALPVRPKPMYQVSSDHTILSMVESGLGVSIMHSLGARADRYRVSWKPFDVHQYRDIGIATAKGARLSGAARLFVEHVRRTLAEA